MADRLAAQATVDDHIRKMLDLMKRGAHVSLTDISDDPTFLMSHFSGSNAKEMAEKIEAKDAELEKLEAANEALDVEIDSLIRELESEHATLASHTSALAEKDEEIARLREAIKPAYLGLLVLKTMCRKAGLTGGVDATESAMTSLVAAMPELPAISALRGSALTDQHKE